MQDSPHELPAHQNDGGDGDGESNNHDLEMLMSSVQFGASPFNLPANFNAGSIANLLGNMASAPPNTNQGSNAAVSGVIRFNHNSAQNSQLFQQQNNFLQQLGVGIKIPNNPGGQWQEQKYQVSKGEVIPGKMFTYHSISELETLINENQALSLDTQSQSGKILQTRQASILALSQEDNDIQLLINQEDFIKNLLAPFKSHTASDHPNSMPALTDQILDFTFCSRHRLYLLYPKLLTVIDLSNLLPSKPPDLSSAQSPNKTIFDSQPDFLDWVSFPQTGLYNSIQCLTLKSVQHILLYNTKASSILTHLSISLDQSEQQSQLVSDVFESDQVQYKLSDNSDRTIQDVQICGQYACVIMERNEIQVIDLKEKQVVFKAQYKDTSAKIVKAYFIEPNAKFQLNRDANQSEESESGYEEEDIGYKREGQRRLALFRNATFKEHSPENPQTPLNGFFLFVENLTTKDQSTQKSHNHFEKLSIAKIINKPTGNSQKPFDQRLQQLDYLKISEKNRKLVDFDQKRGLIFLINKKVATSSTPNSKPCLKLYAIQLMQQYTEEGINNSDSDYEDSMKNSAFIKEGRGIEASGIKFSFIKGMHLQLSSEAIHNISTSSSSQAKRPNFFKILVQKNKTEDGQTKITYFIYTSIGGQILAHSLSLEQDLQPVQQQHHENSEQISNPMHFSLHPQSSPLLLAGSQSMLQQTDQLENQSIFGNDPFFSISASNNNCESDSLAQIDQPSIFMQPSMSFGATPSQDQYLEVDELQDEVKREIQEAIEKEMQQISIEVNMAENSPTTDAVDEAVAIQNVSQSEIKLVFIEEEEIKKVIITDEVSTTEKQQTSGGGKEIKVSVDTFKMIQAVKQGTTQINAAAEKKKKKKAKQKAAAVTAPAPAQVNEETKTQKLIPASQIKPIHSQASTISNSMPFTLVTAPVPLAHQQVQAYQLKAQNVATNNGLRPIASAPQTTQNYMTAASIKKQNSQSNTLPPSKSQEDALIDTFAELTKKYQDLSQKFQKLQDQLSSQSVQQTELDRCIAKNIGQVVPSAIETQLKEKVVPMVLSHMKGIDRSIRDEVMPQVQAQIQEIISKLIRQNKIHLMSQQQEEDLKKRGISIDETTQNEIKTLVIEEFAKAMEQGIRPMLQEQFAGIVTEVKNNLKFLNQEIAQKFVEEQEKNNENIKKLSMRLDAIQSQGNNQGMYPPVNPQQSYGYPQQQPIYAPYPYHSYYAPPTHPHPHPQYQPGYYPQPHMHGSPINYYGYQGQPHSSHSDQRLAEMNLTPQHSMGYPGSHPPTLSQHPSMMQPLVATQPLTQSSSVGGSNFSPLTVPQTFGVNAHSNYFQNMQPPQPAPQQQLMHTPTFSGQLHHNHSDSIKHRQLQNAMPLSTTQEIQNDETEFALTPVSVNQYHQGTMEEVKIMVQSPQQQKIKTEKITKAKSISSNGSNPNEDKIDSPTKKKGKQTSIAAQKTQPEQVINGVEQQTFAQNKKWQILPYMKEVATQGKSSSADFLLCGSQEFLQDTVNFVSENSHIITNQYTYKIIHQFIKKVYCRAMENEKARKGAVMIIGIFIEKIYRVRDNMKQLVCQATQMEQEIKKLIDEDE